MVQHSIQKRAVAEEPIIVVVDDDKDFRDSLEDLFNSVGFKVKLFGSAAELLKGKLLPDVVSCLVLDVRLPGLGGLDFQTELSKANASIPVIFMTGHGDIPMSVKAMKAGAVDFLTKPFRDQDMLDAVTIALERDRTRRKAEQRLTELKIASRAIEPARARGAGSRDHWLKEQADRFPARCSRDHCEGAPRPRDAEDGCAIASRACQNSGDAWHKVAAVLIASCWHVAPSAKTFLFAQTNSCFNRLPEGSCCCVQRNDLASTHAFGRGPG